MHKDNSCTVILYIQILLQDWKHWLDKKFIIFVKKNKLIGKFENTSLRPQYSVTFIISDLAIIFPWIWCDKAPTTSPASSHSDCLTFPMSMHVVFDF